MKVYNTCIRATEKMKDDNPGRNLESVNGVTERRYRSVHKGLAVAKKFLLKAINFCSLTVTCNLLLRFCPHTAIEHPTFQQNAQLSLLGTNQNNTGASILLSQ